MAKNDKVQLTGGLSFGASGETPADKEKGVGPVQEKTGAPEANTLTEGYQKTQQQKYETRDTKMNILVKPSTARKLKEAVERREIRSRNDLINYLLEKYFAEDEKNRG